MVFHIPRSSTILGCHALILRTPRRQRKKTHGKGKLAALATMATTTHCAPRAPQPRLRWTLPCKGYTMAFVFDFKFSPCSLKNIKHIFYMY